VHGGDDERKRNVGEFMQRLIDAEQIPETLLVNVQTVGPIDDHFRTIDGEVNEKIDPCEPVKLGARSPKITPVAAACTAAWPAVGINQFFVWFFPRDIQPGCSRKSATRCLMTNSVSAPTVQGSEIKVGKLPIARRSAPSRRRVPAKPLFPKVITSTKLEEAASHVIDAQRRADSASAESRCV
jgi:hypothetical protein